MAVARFALDALLSDHPVQPFPLGILAVNLLGTFGRSASSPGPRSSGEALTIVAGGVTGSFTTFSTWMLDTRAARGLRPAAASPGSTSALSLLAGFAAVALGHWLGAAL